MAETIADVSMMTVPLMSLWMGVAVLFNALVTVIPVIRGFYYWTLDCHIADFTLLSQRKND